MSYSGPFNRVVTAVDRIADVFTEDKPEDASGNRLADSLERIAEAAEDGRICGGGSGSSGGGVTVVPVVHGVAGEASVIQMAASELFAACQNGIVFIKEAKTIGTDTGVSCDSISIADFIGGAYSFNAGGEIYSAESANDYPASDDTPK